MLDYMHIGASRAASSWVHENIIIHPEINEPASKKHEKNIRFWNSISGSVRIRSIEQYKKTFASVKEGKINVDMSDNSSWAEEKKIKLLKETYPDVKISYSLRNPVDVMWSHMGKQVWDPNANMKLLKELFQCRVYQTNPRRLPFRRNVDYKVNFKIWSRYFDVHAILFDDIKNNPKEVLQNLSDFIGIDKTFYVNNDDIYQVINKGHKTKPATVPSEIATFLIDELSEEIDLMEEVFNKDFSNWRTVKHYE